MGIVMNKISNRVTWIYLGLAVPLILSVIAVDGMAMRLLRRQEEKINSSGVESYAEQLDKMLQGIEEHLVAFCTLESDIDDWQYLALETEWVMAAQQVVSRMKKDVLVYPLMYAEFLYSSYRDSCITVRKNGLSFEERQQVNAMVLEICAKLQTHPETFQTGRWKIYTWESDAFLLYVAGSGEAYMGYLISAKDILAGMPQTDSQKWTGQLFFEGAVAAELVHNGGADGRGVIRLTGKVGDTGLAVRVCMMPISLYDSLHWQQVMFVLIPAAILLTLCMLYFVTSQKIMLPISKTVKVMEQAGAGDLSVRVSTEGMLYELVMIGDTLNEMLEKIDVLQNKERENIWELQKSNLKNLQLQINPHFLGNCLNMVYNASLCGDNDLVLEFTTHLRRYFGLMAQMEKDFVSLSDELEFTNDFLAIQKLRFPAMGYEILVPEYLNQVPVPPSMIKTFAENAVQYSRIQREDILIRIEIALSEGEEEPLLLVAISDNGPGFPPQVLSTLETEGTLYFDGRTHIGIANVKKRLKILYGARAQMELSNGLAGGAKVCVRLPLKRQERGCG